MGKTTLFHPVSLMIIRGSAENCGWRFGRIQQTLINKERTSARYYVQIVDVPRNANGFTLDQIKTELQECFAADIEVRMVKMDTKGRVIATIITSLMAEEWDKPTHKCMGCDRLVWNDGDCCTACQMWTSSD